jgi:hypothetical protein
VAFCSRWRALGRGGVPTSGNAFGQQLRNSELIVGLPTACGRSGRYLPSKVVQLVTPTDDIGDAAFVVLQTATARNHLQRVPGKLSVHWQRRAVLKAALVLIARRPSWSTAYALTNAICVISRSGDPVKPCQQRGAHVRDYDRAIAVLVRYSNSNVPVDALTGVTGMSHTRSRHEIPHRAYDQPMHRLTSVEFSDAHGSSNGIYRPKAQKATRTA